MAKLSDILASLFSKPQAASTAPAVTPRARKEQVAVENPNTQNRGLLSTVGQSQPIADHTLAALGALEKFAPRRGINRLDISGRPAGSAAPDPFTALNGFALGQRSNTDNKTAQARSNLALNAALTDEKVGKYDDATRFKEAQDAFRALIAPPEFVEEVPEVLSEEDIPVEEDPNDARSYEQKEKDRINAAYDIQKRQYESKLNVVDEDTKRYEGNLNSRVRDIYDGAANTSATPVGTGVSVPYTGPMEALAGLINPTSGVSSRPRVPARSNKDSQLDHIPSAAFALLPRGGEKAIRGIEKGSKAYFNSAKDFFNPDSDKPDVLDNKLATRLMPPGVASALKFYRNFSSKR